MVRITQAEYDDLVAKGCVPALEKPKGLAKHPPKRKDLADSFEALWRKHGPPIPMVREYRFHPERKWRFDAAFPEYHVAVELEGGVWTRGRHTRGSGYVRDIEKYNQATMLGWRLIRFTANDIDQSPMQSIELVTKLLSRQHLNN